MTKKILLACAFLLPALPASALSLREAAQLALEHDPRMLATGSELEASAALKRQAQSGYLPTVTLGGDIGRSELQTDAPFPESGLRNPNSASFTVSQPLYTGGATSAQLAVAESGIEGSRQVQREQGAQIILAAVTAYLDVQRDRGVVELNQSSMRMLEKAASDTGKRLDAGEATRTDQAQAKARYAEAQAEYRRATSRLRISEAAFVRLTGVRPDHLTSDWPIPQVPGSLDDVLKLSAQSPAVQAARARAASAKSEIRFADAGRMPRVSLEGNANTQDNTEFGYERLDTWSVKLKLAMPLYQGGLIRAKVSEAEARAESARLNADDAEQAAIESATQQWETLQAADEVIRAYQAQVEAAEFALDGTGKELEAGTRTTLDLLDAERELLSSQVNVVSSRHDRAVTAFRLLAACGGLEATVVPE